MELDLKVWKELAIEKQMLMMTVTEGLGLDDDASEEDIRNGILSGIDQIANTEATITALRAGHEAARAALEQELASEHDKRTRAEREVATLNQDRATLEITLDSTKKSKQTETQSLKSQLESKTRELKNINSLLGDSPANMRKKMKSLNKKKHDETEARKRAETELKNAQKEVRALKNEVESQKARIEELDSASDDEDKEKESIAA